MFLNLKNSLPPWSEKFMLMDEDEGDAWKWRPTIDAAKAMYEQWAEVYGMVVLFADTLVSKRERESEDNEIQLAGDDEGEDDGPFTKRLIYENLMAVAPKIMSAAGDTLYIIKMENAGVIRFNCIKMMEMVGWAALSGEADPKYKVMIQEAMEKFRSKFRDWVATFEKDEIDDEWGLYS